MVKIHGIVYIIVGLFISGVAWKVNKDKLLFFYYVGFVFVLAGVIKIVYRLSTDGKATKALNANSKSIKNSIKPARQQHWKRCIKCGNVMRLHDRFCSRCGNKS